MGAPAAGHERVWFAHAIRGPACLLVVFAHLFTVFPTDPVEAARIGHFDPVTGLPSVPWRGAVAFLDRLGIAPGAVGVLLFFLVSGFVIPFSLAAGHRRGFVVRRIFRLYPTLWVCLGVTVTALAVQARLHLTPFPYDARSVGASAVLAAQYARLPFVEPVLWSLAVEELFYALAAAMAAANALASAAAVVAGGVGLAAVALVTRGATAGGPLFWLGFNATFAAFVLVGVAAHHLHRRTWSLPKGAATAVATYALYLLAVSTGPASAVARWYIPSSIVALVGFAVLFGVRDRLPYSATVDRLSSVSYPLYLLHGVNGYIMLRAVFLLTGSYYVALVATVASALAAATVVHHWVETPTNDFGRRLVRRSRVPAVAPAVP